MAGTRFACADERRRAEVREAGVNGLDHLEVSEDQRTLSVFFLGKAPEEITEANVRVEGGAGATPVEVTEVLVHRQDDPRADDCMEVHLDAPGDRSPYELHLVEADERGRPTDRTLPGFDPRYDRLSFGFKVNCPSDLDCAVTSSCPSPLLPEPEIDYLAKDYAGFRQLILDRLSLVMPDWRERHPPDVGIALAEILAYVGDHLSYYQDAVATEAYLATARQRISVRRHARLVDYSMHEGCNARVFVCLEAGADGHLNPRHLQFLALHRPAPGISDILSPDDLRTVPFGGYEAFEPLTGEPIEVRVAHNRIPFYTWGERNCRLPAGATGATLLDAWADDGPGEQQVNGGEPDQGRPPRRRRLALRAGDVLIFEEVKGVRTGDPEDADRSHRHAVRLTHVDATLVDPLYDRPSGRPVVEVRWAAEDALPFPLCLSAIGRPPECTLIDDIGVARGNVVEADHGRTVHRESLGTVRAPETPPRCEDEGRIAETTVTALPFTPSLQQRPLTFRQPWTPHGPACRLTAQNPRRAEPQIRLAQRGGDAPPGGHRWTPRPDLMDSGPLDRDFVVEMDNEGRAHLRFGDGRYGHRPDPGTRFVAGYRVGNGPAGNVGADTVTRLLLRGGHGDGPPVKPRNPLPAGGGTLPESLDDVKSLAPTAFRTRLERAITTDDYAMLAAAGEGGAPPTVQRAAAELRWTGSWYEVLTTVDPVGKAEADDRMLLAVARRLHRYRRIGHDLVVARAEYVPLDVALSVCVRPGLVSGHVKAALLDILGARELPDGSRGFFHPDNLTFGQGIKVSRLTAAAQKVHGVSSVEVTKLERLFCGPDGELADGVLRLGPCEVACLDNDPDAPDRGRLVLRMRGGR
ncbi:putative baseplate assembly protein [Streptomyces sp. NPDC008196]|uniref:putative baseplate assembly protein n=1 Tax=Streptomyces sp. NPDC008196 TaxID=3364819 RepID=UPI0036E4D301